MLDKYFYNVVLCQSFSPCGKYLITGDIFGEISVFDLSKIISPDDFLSAEQCKPKIKLTLTDDKICSFAKTDKFLICGSIGVITGWNWKSILTQTKNLKPAWTIQLPVAKDSLDKNEVNCLWYEETKELLYAGCGDNNTYAYNLEDGKLAKTLQGHEDYIHSIHVQGDQLVSASEDGSVRLWDIRTDQVTNKLFPHTIDKLNRPHLGKWVGAAVLSDNWLLCGGGPRLALWHLQSLDITTVFPMNDNGIHFVEFYEDRILAGGAAPLFYQFNYNSDVYAEIPSSSTTVYSVIHQEDPYKALCIAGSSSKVDLCTNFSYRDQVLSLN